jgi:DNA-binding Lrp family transcriptional regulator
MDTILKLLERDSRLTPAQIALMLDMTEEEVAAKIAAYEADNTIVGYSALINWDKTERESVTAFIELKVTPERGEGFDKVAERIYNYPQVQTVYLMSGGFDIAVMIEGKSLKEVALFVAEKLATMESVISTSTHFVLRCYKEQGKVYMPAPKDERVWTD